MQATANPVLRDIVLIGGGFLCLEAASVLVSQGKQVRVLELQERVMANAVAPAPEAAKGA